LTTFLFELISVLKNWI